MGVDQKRLKEKNVKNFFLIKKLNLKGEMTEWFKVVDCKSIR